MTPAVISILLVDDHVLLRDGLRRLLAEERDLRVVGEADSGPAAVARARELSPHVVVMDVDMPGGNGIVATETILHERPGTRVLGLSIHDQEPVILQMLRAGARGFLPKDCAFGELVHAVRVIAAGETYLSPRIVSPAIKRLLTGRDPRDGDLLAALTPREREVLSLIADGLGTRAIAERLCISVKTVETHRAHIMEKTRRRSVAGLTKLAVAAGLSSLDR